MGLDIAFNRILANDAGIEKEYIRNSDRTEFDDVEDPEYVKWCQESSLYIRAPGMEFWAEDSGEGSDCYIIRANKWGRVYKPMTEWLTKNNIAWDEF